jgi:N-acyl-phosphatidylethanolamine-hydrolysing phospholipase D
MCPKEAVQVSLDLQSTYSLGVHWGTFLMSDEFYMDPKHEFEKAREEMRASGCFTLPFGETRVLRV